MKAEPLKGKQRYYLDGVRIHHTEDVASAVQWLKQFFHNKDEAKYLKLINEAFADVVEVKK